MTRPVDVDAVVHTSGTGIFAAVTPSDTAVIKPTRGIYVGVSGDLKVRGAVDGATVSFVGLAAGVEHAIRCDMVFATGQPGSIATSIVALY